MTAIILTLHTLIVLGLIVVVLLQRSDGGALGIGGGGGGGGFMTGRGAANALTRTTSILAACFFATSLSLAVIAGGGEDEESVIEGLTGQAAPGEDGGQSLSAEDIMGTLGGGDEPGAAETGADGEADVDAVLESLGTMEPEEATADQSQGDPAEEPTPE